MFDCSLLFLLVHAMGAFCGKEEQSRKRQASYGCFGGKEENEKKTDFVEEKDANCVCFGAGCYWGTEKFFKHEFMKLYPSSNIRGVVGFMGPIGAVEQPTYEEVCVGDTGHVEVYFLEYDGGIEMFENLVKFFFTFHDPTTPNKQGNDRGTQYTSVIYCYGQKQKQVATRIKNELQDVLNKSLQELLLYKNFSRNVYSNKTIYTKIEECTKFYPAHAAHQEYLMKNPKGYCNHRIRFRGWPELAMSPDSDSAGANVTENPIMQAPSS